MERNVHFIDDVSIIWASRSNLKYKFVFCSAFMLQLSITFYVVSVIAFCVQINGCSYLSGSSNAQSICLCMWWLQIWSVFIVTCYSTHTDWIGWIKGGGGWKLFHRKGQRKEKRKDNEGNTRAFILFELLNILHI